MPGHNIAGRALQDGVLLIDVSRLRTVHVDPDEKTAVISPGATLADIDHETQAYGLALPVGINSTTGIAGLTLGGGFGWLSRTHGMTVDQLVSVEVVTVDGERLVCDQENHSDLFWSLQGGGGNFAVVTSFKFKLAPLGPDVMCGPIIHEIKDAKKVLTAYREFCQNSPRELTVWAILRYAPPFPFLDSSHHGKPVLVLVAFYDGSVEEGEKAISKLKEIGNPIGDGVSPHSFVDFQQAFDPLLTPGERNYWKTHNFKEISDGLIDTLVTYGNQIPSKESEIFLAQLGGAINDVPEDATAYPHRDIEFIMNVHTRWENADQDDTCISWAREFHQATRPFATGGVYVNFVSEGDDSIEAAYSENAERLSKIKTKYDPKNSLRANLNLKPG